MAPKKRSHELSLSPGRASGAPSTSPRKRPAGALGQEGGTLLHMRQPEPGAGDVQRSVVARNLVRLRTQRGVTREELAARAGTSTDELATLERGELTPTIERLWQLASALGVRFSALLQEAPVEPERARPAAAPVRRALLSAGPLREGATEVHELRLPAHAETRATRAPAGMFETLLVTAGSVLVRRDREAHLLEPGDALSLPVDEDRIYVNPGDRDAILFAMIAPSPRA
jgi:transcriptional regulator with XRE-family HTH domain